MFNDIFKAVGPMVAAAMAAKAADWENDSRPRRHGKRGFPFGDAPFNPGRFGFGPGGFQFEFDSEAEGMTLDDIDLMADPPEKLVLFGPDRVRVVEGQTFRVKAEGPAADELRFIQKSGMLGVLRPSFDRRDGQQEETVVTITVPPLRSLVIAGSGTVEAGALAERAKLTIAGSGAIELVGLASERLEINVLGSGRITAAGTAEKMRLNIAGSGLSDMVGLEVERAKVTVAGSGSAVFASDGVVDAHIMGSGVVTVHGRAKCSVHSMGSGRLVCVAREDAPAPPAEPAKPAKPAKAKSKPAPKTASKKASAKPAKPAKAASKSALRAAAKPKKKS